MITTHEKLIERINVYFKHQEAKTLLMQFFLDDRPLWFFEREFLDGSKEWCVEATDGTYGLASSLFDAINDTILKWDLEANLRSSIELMSASLAADLQYRVAQQVVVLTRSKKNRKKRNGKDMSKM